MKTGAHQLRLFVVLTVAVACGAWVTQPASEGRPTVAIVGATIVDGTGSPPFVGTLVFQGERIVRVDRGTAVPDGGRAIDASGMTLLPGLFDLHTHVQAAPAGGAADWQKHLAAYVYAGVTSIAELGSYSENFDSMRALQRSTSIVAPRVALASRVASPGGHGAESGRPRVHTREVFSPADAQDALSQILGGPRPDLIKAFHDGWRYGTAPDMTSLSRETLTAIVEGAHRAGLPVITHTVTVAQARVAVGAGVDIIGHGIGDADVDVGLVDLMRTQGVTYAPTMSVYEPRSGAFTTPLLAEVLDPSGRRALDDRRQRGGSPPDGVIVAARQRRWSFLRRNVALLRQGGVRFGLGTDAGMPSTFHGSATLHELALLVDSSLTPLEALTAATGNSARALRVDGDRGTLQAGRLADLVLVDGRPHESIQDMARVQRVWLGGQEVDREALRAAIATDTPTPAPAARVTQRVDDFEREDGRAAGGQLWVDYSDSGHDRSRVSWTRRRRSPENHALLAHARLANKEGAFARISLALVGGGLLPVDASMFSGLRFEVRGEGTYRLIVGARAASDGAPLAAAFSADPTWRTVQIPFSSLTREGGAGTSWAGRDLVSLAFELAGDAGSDRWIELDNVSFVR